MEEIIEMIEDYILLSWEQCKVKRRTQRLKEQWHDAKLFCSKSLHRPKLFVKAIKNHLNNN